MSEKQAGSIAGWGNRLAITGWGPWDTTPPLQTFQWIIGDSVQCSRTPPCLARTQGGCSPLHPQRMRNVTGDAGMICKWYPENSKIRKLPANSRELATQAGLKKVCLGVSLGPRRDSAHVTPTPLYLWHNSQGPAWLLELIGVCLPLGCFPYKANHTCWSEQQPLKSDCALDD